MEGFEIIDVWRTKMGEDSDENTWTYLCTYAGTYPIHIGKGLSHRPIYYGAIVNDDGRVDERYQTPYGYEVNNEHAKELCELLDDMTTKQRLKYVNNIWKSLKGIEKFKI